MAEELDWEIEAFDEAFREAFAQGMVKADFKARVMWLPSAIKHNRPESPNVVRSWGAEFDLIPECDLKREAFESLKASIHALGESFAKAFDESLAEPSPKPSRKPSPKAMANQEQEQEQEQKQDQEQEHPGGLQPPGPPAFAPTPSAPPPAAEPAPAPKAGPAPAPKPRKAAEPKPEPPTVGTWKAYSQAYAVRYRTDPLRNAMVNGQLANLVARLGAEVAPAVAAFYVRSNNARYVGAGHSIGMLLMDAEKLHTEWKTGQQGTHTQARLADRAQSNFNAFAPLIEEARAQQQRSEHGHT